MDISQFLLQPFVLGLGLGILFAAVVFLYGWSRHRALKSDIESQKVALAATVDALIRARDELDRENKELTKKNSNLKATAATLIESPKKIELRTLRLYDTALDAMKIGAPGFVGAWEKYMIDAQDNMDKIKGGCIPFIRNKIRLPKILPAPSDQS